MISTGTTKRVRYFLELDRLAKIAQKNLKNKDYRALPGCVEDIVFQTHLDYTSYVHTHVPLIAARLSGIPTKLDENKESVDEIVHRNSLNGFGMLASFHPNIYDSFSGYFLKMVDLYKIKLHDIKRKSGVFCKRRIENIAIGS